MTEAAFMSRVTGTSNRPAQRGPVFYPKYRLADGRQVQKCSARVDAARPPAGGLLHGPHGRRALQELLADARRGTLAGAEPRAGKTSRRVRRA